MRWAWKAIALGAAATLALAATALATNQPSLSYNPPRILFRDLSDVASSENVTVVKDGSDFVITSTPSGMSLDLASDPGCDGVPNGWACPVAGVETIVVKLGDLPDTGSIDLGSRADKVRQTLDGGERSDTIEGGRGKQRLLGRSGGDEIKGGAGDDFIDGGPGNDACSGGPGDDTIKNCEQ